MQKLLFIAMLSALALSAAAQTVPHDQTMNITGPSSKSTSQRIIGGCERKPSMTSFVHTICQMA